MIPIIDTHAHLEMVPEETRGQIIEKARKEGISLILDVGTDLEGSRQAAAIARENDFIYSAAGIHPHEVSAITEKTYEGIEEILSLEKTVALGEIGLDYFKEYSPADLQRQAFREQIRLARNKGIPVIVHSRDAKEDTLRILREEKVHEVGGILHCFSGDSEMARVGMEQGLYLSFAGPITYPSAGNLREVLKEVPLDRLLVETDSPYLAPQKFRGKKNEPAYVRLVAEKAAELKGVELAELSSHLHSNIRDLFGIEPPGEGDILTYKIRDSLYLNITNRCTSDCVFCTRKEAPIVKGYNLRLHREPEAGELLREIGDPTAYEEIVFCGYGEPLLRLDVIKEVAKEVKKRGGKIRINTNGHGNLIHRRNILPELKGLVDSMSISLNSENEEDYNRLNRPAFKSGAYQAVKEFIIEAQKVIPSVTASVVAIPEEVDVGRCEEIAGELNVRFRARNYNVVG